MAVGRQNFEDAVRKCDAALAKQPHDPKVLRQRGEAKRKLGLFEQSVSDFNSALALKPNFANALAGRGAARRALGQIGEAFRDYDAALAVEPHNPNFLLDRGSARHASGDTAGALKDAEAAIKLRPGHAPLLQFRGEVRRKLGKHDEAVRDFDAALALDPNNVPSLAGRGAARRALGLRAQALNDFDQAIALAPRNPAVFAGRGATRLELRMADAARTDFEMALSLSPGHDFARWGREAAIQQLKTAGQQLAIAGFSSVGLNAAFSERRRPGYLVNGYPTYWTADGQYFLYWCQAEGRWKGTSWKSLGKVQQGGTSGFISAPPGQDIRLSDGPLFGWFEFDGKEWFSNKNAGLTSVVSLEVNLQAITLCGFARDQVNVRYEERYKPRYQVNGHETYWAKDGQRFLYWSAKERRWKGTEASSFARVQGGANLGFIGAPVGVDITTPGLAKGWFEWDGTEWVYSGGAGVHSVTTLTTAVPQVPESLRQRAAPREGGAGGEQWP